MSFKNAGDVYIRPKQPRSNLSEAVLVILLRCIKVAGVLLVAFCTISYGT